MTLNLLDPYIDLNFSSWKFIKKHLEYLVVSTN